MMKLLVLTTILAGLAVPAFLWPMYFLATLYVTAISLPLVVMVLILLLCLLAGVGDSDMVKWASYHAREKERNPNHIAGTRYEHL